MKKRIFVWMTMFMMINVVTSPVQAQTITDELLAYSEVKVTLVADGTEYEWEYQNPHSYEFEKGSFVAKGEEAKEDVLNVFDALSLNKNADVEGMVKRLKELGYKDISSFRASLIDRDRCLYTWVWNDKEEGSL
ncbi:hypothetical protein [Alteribacter aurantiacus]|uniref:hypothetical protein n=1 Tax=Alteribacter aurantiacus TaxID=254410 RepID=UPI00041D1218|nr:hypothetical protein [Alteribacter aurantiacus]